MELGDLSVLKFGSNSDYAYPIYGLGGDYSNCDESVRGSIDKPPTSSLTMGEGQATSVPNSNSSLAAQLKSASLRLKPVGQSEKR